MTGIDPGLATRLAKGIEALGLTLPSVAPQQLLDFVGLLHKWNKAYNLSGIRDPEQMLSLHILDSLALCPYIDADTIADVGTGAGLPGLPLAICFPDKKFTLIDSNSKKTRFVFQTAAALGLRNVEVVHSRAEHYESHPQVAIVTSRAFASLADFVGSCEHLLAPQGKFLAMKGQYPDVELAALPAHYRLIASHRLQIPGTDASRHLLDIRSGDIAAQAPAR